MTSPLTLIVFDCDGTLVDSQHVICEAMRLTFQGAGLEAPERSAILGTVGLSIDEAIAALAPDWPAELRNPMAPSYREWCTALRQQPHMQEPMFKGAAGLLFDLARNPGVMLGIATGKSRRGVMRFIERNDLQGCFSTIQTADDAPSKPHPAMLLQAMHETGATPETTVMVGDTSYDIMMAAHAKAAGIGVSWGYHPASELKRAGAQHVVTSFAALAWVLAKRYALAHRLEAVA
jgi:phosphoglycolate phosphatase